MTTEECQIWARSALALYKDLEASNEKITLLSAFNRFKPTEAQDSDYNLALSMLTAMASRSDKRVVNVTHDPLMTECRQLNADALSQVLHETGATINAAEFRAWRPTVRNVGAIAGVSVVKATILATDGNLGLFQDDSGTFFGHIQHFSGIVRTLFSVSKGATVEQNQPGDAAPKVFRKARVKRKSPLEAKADKLLADLGIDL